jgi:asparagine synthase (glutamine-hydrolysing)
MCGIVGIYNSIAFDSQRSQDVLKMCNSIKHRGPDDHGVFDGDYITLGHQRLSIIDLSPGGHQPFSTSDGKIKLVYNGELYNFLAIRKELENAGYFFKTSSDTEVVLNAYNEYGYDCFKQFKGMFALAIWDARDTLNPRLVLARDHFGIKPLLYSHSNNKFVFSSELKAFLEIGDYIIDPVSKFQFFYLGYILQPNTVFKDVKSLAPASFAVIDKDFNMTILKYWDTNKDISDFEGSYDEQKAAVRELLVNSVNEQLVSDVNLGAFLSGGIDSTLIVSIIAKLLNKKINTYTVGFQHFNSTLDESELASKSAKILGVNHTNKPILESEIVEAFNNLPFAMDQPTIGWPQWYLVSKAAKENLTVSLSGLGADEYFYGYNWLFKPQGVKSESIQFFSGALGFMGLEENIMNRIGDNLYNRSNFFYEFFNRHLIRFPNEVHNLTDSTIGIKSAFSVFQSEFGKRKYKSRSDFFSQLVSTSRMVSQDIRDIDVASMLNSLEVRVPFLDTDLVELAIKLPESSKFGKSSNFTGRRGKKVLIDAFADILPAHVYNRPKTGFNLPFKEMLNSILRENVSMLFANKDLIDFAGLNYSTVQLEWNGFKSGKISYNRIWSIVSWLKYFDSIKK